MKDYCHIMVSPLFAFCFILSKTTYDIRILCFNTSKNVVKDCIVIRQIIKLFYRDAPDKMAATGKLSPRFYGVIVIF